MFAGACAPFDEGSFDLTPTATRAALALLFAVPAASAAAQGPPPPPPMAMPVARPKPGPAPPGVAATVNGQKITTAQVNTLIAPAIATQKKQLSARATDILINNLLVEQAAKAKGLTASPAEVAAKLAEARTQIQQQQIQQRQPVQPLEALVAQQGETMADFKNSLRLRVLAEKLVAPQLTPVKMAHVQYLLVSTANPRNDPSVKVKTDADAQKIIAKAQADLKAGKTFAEVVKAYSDDPSTKDTGGDLGIIGPTSGLDPAFLQAALALAPGDVTPAAVKAPTFGLFLIKSLSTSTAPGTDKAQYDKQMQAAHDTQLRQLIPAFLQGLRAKAKVVNYLGQ